MKPDFNWVQCRYCGKEMRPGNLATHEPLCALYPGDDILADWIEDGWHRPQIAEECGVSTHVVTRWLERAGLKTAYTRDKKAEATGLLELADKSLAPLKTRCCESCNALETCQERERAGLWCLCAVPSKLDVCRAVEQGLFVYPDPEPDWLVDFMKNGLNSDNCDGGMWKK